MKLKTKLTLAIALLVLLVLLAVNLVYIAGIIQQRLQEVYTHSSVIAEQVVAEMNQELAAAYRAGEVKPADAQSLTQFVNGLTTSPALGALLAADSGFDHTIRDIAVVGRDGVVVLDSNPLLEGTRAPSRSLLNDVLGSGLAHQVGAIFLSSNIYNVTLATNVGNQPMGAVDVGVDMVLLKQSMIGEIKGLAIDAALIILLATGVAWGLSDLVLHPLGRISAQLDALGLAPANNAVSVVAGGEAGAENGVDFGAVSTKIERLGRRIADARQVYSALQENVSHVLDSLEEGLLLFDASGQSIMASAATPHMLGLEPGAVVGRAVEELFPAPGGLDRAVRLAVRQQVAMEAREAVHSGGRTLLVRLDLVRDQGSLGGQRSGALLTLRDAEPVNRLENELEVARRLSAVGRLTRGVAHEVKNPLNAMAIHLDLLREKAGANANGLQPHVAIMRREIERLDRVVRTFLDFTKPVEVDMVLVDLSLLVESVEQLAAAGAAAQNVRIVVRAPHPGPQVWLDRDMIEQALLNLINNGIQAMCDAPEGELRLEVWEQDQHAMIRVRDQGVGIPPENRDKVFDLYFTTRQEGTGIGLTFAAKTMQLHHGSIELEPSERGASFLLRFPRRRGGTAV
ncbi:MAG TPA: ATP-binding protein [Terriglobales bacterium]|nr:ATP-binding protein [Terriglobales bacterium]